MKVKLVIGTRLNQDDFLKKSATGRSLALNLYPNLEIRLFPNNSKGLPFIYNQAILECINDPAIMVFAHDDLHLLDFNWCEKIFDALQCFDIVGLAGNKRRVADQPSWAFVDSKFTWDQPENLSGIVGHGTGFPPTNLSFFGKPRQEVKLLDGLLIAAKSNTLIEQSILFDERFDFHFYDLDLCRQAEVKKIKCGTWDISVIHESGGSFGSESWQEAYREYILKWEK